MFLFFNGVYFCVIFLVYVCGFVYLGSFSSSTRSDFVFFSYGRICILNCCLLYLFMGCILIFVILFGKFFI